MNSFARTWGQGQGQEALLLHCSLAHSGAWDGMARRLSDRLHMTAPDLVGHGKGPDRDPDQDYHDQCANLVRGYLPDVPCHLIGHSFGATLALRLAIEHPDQVASLTLIEPVLFAAAPDSPGSKTQLALDAALAAHLAAGEPEVAARAFLPVWGGRVAFDDLPPAQARYMTERIWVIVASHDALHGDRAHLVPRLDRVTCPVLLLEGAQSPPVISDIQTALGKAWPGHRRAVVEGAGHMVPITHPHAVADEIGRFLS